jgi:hypothetical protein
VGGLFFKIQDLQPQTQLQLNKETLSIKFLKLDLKFTRYMNKDLILNFKDALLLLNVHIIGPKKCRVSYQLVAFMLML